MNSQFRNAYGLFWEARYRPVLMIISNIVVSIVMVKAVGMVGVFIGTIFGRVFTVGIMDPYIVHKYGLKQNLIRYHIDMLEYIITMGIGYVLINWLLSKMNVTNIGDLVLKGLLSFILVNIFFLLVFFKTERIKYFFDVIKRFIRKKQR